MAITRITTGQKHIYFANDADVCKLCEKEKAENEHISLSVANYKLRKSLTGKKVFKLFINGLFIVLCEHHIKKLAESFYDSKEETKNE